LLLAAAELIFKVVEISTLIPFALILVLLLPIPVAPAALIVASN